MISFFKPNLTHLSIHRIGNKIQDERYILSQQSIQLKDELLGKLLIQYFLNPYEKVNEVYQFYHSNENLTLNEVYYFASEIFNDADTFHKNSQQLAKYLYEVSNHPKIKSGELYVAYFKDVQIDGELLDAIGLFKSETKETYLKVYPEKDGFGVSYEQEAININKLDKGCLIFNTEKEQG